MTLAVEHLSSGEFVEFKALLRKNPLVVVLETFRTWAGIGLQLEALDSGQAEQEVQPMDDQIAAAFLNSLVGNAPTAGDHNQPNASPEQQLAEQHPVYRMIKLFENALTEKGSLEIIGELLGAPGATAVLSTRFESFEDGDATGIIDGEFRVLGKVVRVVTSEGEGSINLLRKTAFGAIKEKHINELAELLTKREESPEEIPIELPDIQTSIEGPAILVLPMAIFV